VGIWRSVLCSPEGFAKVILVHCPKLALKGTHQMKNVGLGFIQLKPKTNPASPPLGLLTRPQLPHLSPFYLATYSCPVLNPSPSFVHPQFWVPLFSPYACCEKFQEHKAFVIFILIVFLLIIFFC
jgi:hypothetical protein